MSLSKFLPAPIAFTPSEEYEFMLNGARINCEMIICANRLLEPTDGSTEDNSDRRAAFQAFLVSFLTCMSGLDDTEDAWGKTKPNDFRYTKAFMFSFVELISILRCAMQEIIHFPRAGYSKEFFMLLSEKFETTYLGVMMGWKMDLYAGNGGNPIKLLAEAVYKQPAANIYGFQALGQHLGVPNAEENVIQDNPNYEDPDVPRPTKVTLKSNGLDFEINFNNNAGFKPAPRLLAPLIDYPDEKLIAVELDIDNIAQRPRMFNGLMVYQAKNPGTTVEQKLGIIASWKAPFCKNFLEKKLRLCYHSFPHLRMESGVQEGPEHKMWVNAHVELMKLWNQITKDMEAHVLRETEGECADGELVWSGNRVKELEESMRAAMAELRDAAIYEWEACQKGGWKKEKKTEWQRDMDTNEQIEERQRMRAEYQKQMEAMGEMSTLSEVEEEDEGIDGGAD